MSPLMQVDNLKYIEISMFIVYFVSAKTGQIGQKNKQKQLSEPNGSAE